MDNVLRLPARPVPTATEVEGDVLVAHVEQYEEVLSEIDRLKAVAGAMRDALVDMLPPGKTELPYGIRCNVVRCKGRRTLDTGKITREYPELYRELEPYWTEGEEFVQLRITHARGGGK